MLFELPWLFGVRFSWPPYNRYVLSLLHLACTSHLTCIHTTPHSGQPHTYPLTLNSTLTPLCAQGVHAPRMRHLARMSFLAQQVLLLPAIGNEAVHNAVQVGGCVDGCAPEIFDCDALFMMMRASTVFAHTTKFVSRHFCCAGVGAPSKGTSGFDLAATAAGADATVLLTLLALLTNAYCRCRPLVGHNGLAHAMHRPHFPCIAGTTGARICYVPDGPLQQLPAQRLPHAAAPALWHRRLRCC